MNFADRLASAIARTGTFACVGIDPVLDKLPPPLRTGDPHTAIGTFARGVIDAVADVVPIIKLQSACFERFGHRGYAQLEETAFHARSRGLLVILDAKRADIGITAEHYAAAAFDQIGADALTVNPYLGPDTIEPFLRPDRGLFVLVRTSNPGSDEVQAQPLAAGPSVAELIAEQVTRLGNTQTGGTGTSGLSSVGAVVGATKASDANSAQASSPPQPECSLRQADQSSIRNQRPIIQWNRLIGRIPLGFQPSHLSQSLPRLPLTKARLLGDCIFFVNQHLAGCLADILEVC